MNKHKYSIKNIAEFLADRKNRVWAQAFLLLFGAAFLLVFLFSLDVPNYVTGGDDKILHYIMGKLISTVTFYLLYFCIIVRLMLTVKAHGSLTRVLLWLPPLVVCSLVFAVFLLFMSAFLKEFYDLSGFGTFDLSDIKMTFEGAVSIVYPVAAIMTLTPFCIPLDIQMQMPKLFYADLSAGGKSIDRYFRAERIHYHPGQHTDILILENDVDCAIQLIDFFRRFHLTCSHVSTVTDANKFINHKNASLDVFVLGNFIRVDDTAGDITGTEFLDELSGRFHAEKLPFITILITGYTRFLDPNKNRADLVLQKPFDEKQLKTFLAKKGLIC